MKKWGKGEFWGIGSEYDPEFLLTDRQKKLRDDLIELCRTKIRPNAASYDKDYTFPRESLDALSELGLLGLTVPEEFGGLGENHIGIVMVCETIARYGCPSTAMVYVMHLLAISLLVFSHQESSLLRDLLRRINKEKLIGSLAFSDPTTGSHFWYPLSSKTKFLNKDEFQLFKFGSWVTSCGHADWYCIQTVSPDFDGDHSNLMNVLVYKDEIRANTADWEALGMHGNMSGPMIIEGKFGTDRIIGKPGDGQHGNEEIAGLFMVMSSSIWNGISLGLMDLAKRHVTRKAHADAGMRICDYPTIQDYFGECMSETNSSRGFNYLVCQAMDSHAAKQTKPGYFNRGAFEHWVFQTKFVSAKNVSKVGETMLRACGGTGFKTAMGLERLLRDSKAGWLMAVSNEVTRQYVGKTLLENLDAFDFWEQKANKRVVHHEIQKMSIAERKVLADELLKEVETAEEGREAKHPFQDSDFDNPFNTCPTAANDKVLKTSDGMSHDPALNPESWTTLTLKSNTAISDSMHSFVFSLPNPTDHTGCFTGQYVRVRVNVDGREEQRFFSPVTRPDDFGLIELVLKLESHGIISQHFKTLKPGDQVEFLGPCGGFEYEANKLDELTLLASGGGVTPAMQIVRAVMNNPDDKTRIKLIYFSENYNEILYKEELDRFAANDSRLSIVYTLEDTPEEWDGEEGFIDTQMIDKYVTKPNSIKHKIIMSGGLTMAITCLHSLRSLGFASDTIFLFGQFGTELIRKVFGRNVRLSGHRC